MTTMNDAERAGFEAVYGTIKPEDHATGDDQAIYELERIAFQAGAAWQRAQGEVQRLREALERATKLLSAAAGYATKMEPMPAKLLNAIDAELDASTGQEVEK